MFIGLIPMANKEKMKIENKQALYSAYFIVVVGTDIKRCKLSAAINNNTSMCD